MTTPKNSPEAIAKFKAGAQAILDDPEAFRKECDAAALADNPKLTQEQLDESWKQMAEQFGL